MIFAESRISNCSMKNDPGTGSQCGLCQLTLDDLIHDLVMSFPPPVRGGNSRITFSSIDMLRIRSLNTTTIAKCPTSPYIVRFEGKRRTNNSFRRRVKEANTPVIRRYVKSGNKMWIPNVESTKGENECDGQSGMGAHSIVVLRTKQVYSGCEKYAESPNRMKSLRNL